MDSQCAIREPGGGCRRQTLVLIAEKWTVRFRLSAIEANGFGGDYTQWSAQVFVRNVRRVDDQGSA